MVARLKARMEVLQKLRCSFHIKFSDRDDPRLKLRALSVEVKFLKEVVNPLSKEKVSIIQLVFAVFKLHFEKSFGC